MNKVHLSLLLLAVALAAVVWAKPAPECFTDSCVGCTDDCLKAEQYVEEFLKGKE